MLSKKQYIYTLVIAVLVFAIVFVIAFVYMKNNSWHIDSNEEVNHLLAAYAKEEDKEKGICILPQTKITLRNQYANQKYSNETRLNPVGLLGLNQAELARRFNEYEVATFNEKEVVLVKKIEPIQKKENTSQTYVLGVEDHYVCIKEKGSHNRPVKIDYVVDHFSKYVYSLLLNEEIEITSAQKEKLLLKPSTLQSILQGYIGE